MHDWMILLALDIGFVSVGMAPIRAFAEPPPLAPIFQINRMSGRREHQRAGIEHVRQRAGIIFRVRWNLGKRLVPVRGRRAFDPKIADGDAMDRRLFRIMFFGAHAERAAGNKNGVGCASKLIASALVAAPGVSMPVPPPRRDASHIGALPV
jgi:hypothetical protein